MREVVLTIGAFFSAMIGLAMWGDSYSCSSRWSQSRIETSWGPMQGCLIKSKSGVFVPEQSFSGADINELLSQKAIEFEKREK